MKKINCSILYIAVSPLNEIIFILVQRLIKRKREEGICLSMTIVGETESKNRLNFSAGIHRVHGQGELSQMRVHLAVI